MQDLEHFFTSPINVKPSAQFKHTLLEQVLSSYHQHSLRNLIVHRLRWILPVPLVIACSLIIFLKVSANVIAHKEEASLNTETQDLELQIKNDPVIAQAMTLPD